MAAPDIKRLKDDYRSVNIISVIITITIIMDMEKPMWDRYLSG